MYAYVYNVWTMQKLKKLILINFFLNTILPFVQLCKNQNNPIFVHVKTMFVPQNSTKTPN